MEEVHPNTEGWVEGSGDASEVIVGIEYPRPASVFQELPLPATGSD